MIKRDIIDKLVMWKDDDKRKPLILTGVRQCGKISSISPVGFKFSLKNVSRNMVENTETYSLPLYLVYRIREYL